LFDSGNGCYTKAANECFKNIKIYPIGIDIENKNSHFINLDLSDYSEIFTGDNPIFEKLDKLPKPDLIIASPPCESWSIATAIKNGTNYWQAFFSYLLHLVKFYSTLVCIFFFFIHDFKKFLIPKKEVS